MNKLNVGNAPAVPEYIGGRGLSYVIDATKTDAPDKYVFVCIEVVQGATFSALTPTADAPLSGAALTGVAWAAGQRIYGRFTSFTLSSGQVLAYLGAY